MYQSFFFDFDGVLSDSERLTWSVVDSVLGKMGVERFSGQPDVGGWTWLAIAKLVNEEGGLDDRLLADSFADEFEQQVARSPRLIPGADRALRCASKLGSVAIVTGSRRGVVQTWLDHFSLRDTVDTIVSAGSYARPKPEPDCYKLALSRLKTKPDKVLVFEDSNAGIQAAAAAHLRVIAIANGQSRNTGIQAYFEREIASFEPLLEAGFFDGEASVG